MKVVKDTPFEFGYQMWQVRPPQPSLMVLVKGTYKLVPGGRCVIAEKQRTTTGEVYYDNDAENSVQYDTDFAILKKRGECFLVGTCHPPGGRADTAVVNFRVGSVHKALAVIGDRSWRRGLSLAASRPEPFTSMPLRWERSFGGPGFDANPVGRGVARAHTPEGSVTPLPNIEDPHRLIRDPGDRPEPAGAFPILSTWRSRSAKVGTVDQHWVDTRWPWYPVDFDWSYFNAAPADQQINGFWRGDEELSAQNLHPEFQSFRTQLPGLRARLFLEIRSGSQLTFSEVALHLDTITLDTDAMQVVCVWRGLVEVPSEELTEVETLFYVHEPLEESRSLEDCRAWLERKRSEETAEEASFEPETPADEAGASPAEPPPPSPPPPVDPLEETVKGIEADAAAARARPDGAAEAAMLSGIAAMLLGTRAPEPPTPDGSPSQARAELQAQGMEVPAEVAALPDPPPDAAPAAEAPPPEPPGLSRDEVLARHARQEPFAGEDLTGVDLSGLDLTGANFAEALMPHARLVGCGLNGAVFDGATLAGADLTESSMVGASFKETDLTGARAYRANADRAVFDGAQAAESAWSGTRFQGASFKAADFTQAVIEDGNFEDAMLDAADFTRARMERGNFRRASAVDARFDGTLAPHAVFDDANLTKLRASERADFTEASMRGVKAAGARWGTSVLNKVNLSRAVLDGADFAAAGLVQAQLTGCSIKGAHFQGASLVGAVMLKSNAFESNFEGADLSHADLRGSNFFGAQFFRAKTRFAQLELANVGRTHLARARK